MFSSFSRRFISLMSGGGRMCVSVCVCRFIFLSVMSSINIFMHASPDENLCILPGSCYTCTNIFGLAMEWKWTPSSMSLGGGIVICCSFVFFFFRSSCPFENPVMDEVEQRTENFSPKMDDKKTQTNGRNFQLVFSKFPYAFPWLKPLVRFYLIRSDNFIAYLAVVVVVALWFNKSNEVQLWFAVVDIFLCKYHVAVSRRSGEMWPGHTLRVVDGQS